MFIFNEEYVANLVDGTENTLTIKKINKDDINNVKKVKKNYSIIEI